jgi:hypothetical protein
MSTERTQEQPAEPKAAACTAPVKLARRSGAALDAMKQRVLPNDGVSRLDVAAFNSSI